MKHGSATSNTPHRPLRKCQRTRDLKALLDTLNLWAMAPDSHSRTEALKSALRAYQRGLKRGIYPSINKKTCASTAACNEVPAGDFVEFFGDAGEDTDTRSTTKGMK